MTTKDTILRRIAAHDGEWGWYQLERFISPNDLPPGKSVMSLVDELIDEGLIVEVPVNPIPKYRLTDKGKAQIDGDSSHDNSTSGV